MKKTTTLLLAMLMLFAFAQATPTGPQIPYQAVARDASGALIANQTVSLRFTIHDLTAGGTNVFQETGSATTNEFGLFTYNIGANVSLSGVNWASGSKFMQIEIDVTGGTSYTDMGTQQMLYVPYAMYALSSGNGAGPAGPTGANGTNGTNGATGPTGSNGTNGVTGPTGASGADGVNGANGATGANGNNGTNGANGATGPTGATGANGTNGANGATGPTGANGTNGNNGTNGANGATGPTGANGNNGTNGANGVTGPVGPMGNNGATGPAGTNGANGANGPTGPTGPAGGSNAYTMVSVNGSTSYTVPSTSILTYLFDWQGAVGSSQIITITLLPASSYPAGTILYFNSTGYITSAPTFSFTTSVSGTQTWSSFNNNRTDISAGHTVAGQAGAGSRVISDGVSRWFRAN